MSKIEISGRFTTQDMHTWISICLPGVPMLPDDDDVKLIFKSLFLETYLILQFKKGWASILSDNLTTLTIIKDTITNEASNRKLQVDI